MNMKSNKNFFPKEKYKHLTKLNLFRGMFASTYSLHLSLILFVYSFFPDSHTKIDDVVWMSTLSAICWIWDFRFMKLLCLAENKYYFYLRMFFTLSFLQAAVNYLVGWDSSWRYISITLGMIYCFIFAFYTSEVFEKLMKS